MLPLPLLAQPPFPYHRVWNFPTAEQIETAGVSGDLVYYGTFHDFGVVRISDGKPVWHKRLPASQFSAPCVAGDGTLFVAAGKGALSAYALQSGKPLWSVPIRGYSAQPLYTRGVVISQVSSSVLAGLDAKTGKVRWRYSFPSGGRDEELTTAPIVHGDKVAFSDNGGGVFCLDILTGREAWKAPKGTATQGHLISAGGGLYGFSDTDLIRLDSRTGKTTWRSHSRGTVSKGPVLSDGALVFQTEIGELQAVDAVTGRERWHLSLNSPGQRTESYSGLTNVPEGLLTFIEGDALLIAPSGKQKLRAPVPVESFELPGTWTGKRLLVYDSHSIACMVPGAQVMTAKPAARVRALLAHLDKMTPAEKREFISYGRVAMEAILPELEASLKAYLAAARTKSPKAEQAFSRYYDLAMMAREVMTPEATPRVLALAMESAGSEAESLTLNVLQRGDESVTTPYFLDLLSRPSKGEGEEWGIALQAIVVSRDPRAVQWKLAAMRDPKTSNGIRYAIYPLLAQTAGSEGVEIVRSLRLTDRTILPPTSRIDWTEAVKPDRGRISLTAKDKQGQEWLLFQSTVLGSYGDLWIARKSEGHWVHPVFTGVNLAPTSGFVSKKRVVPADDPKIKALLSGGWLSSLAGNANLEKDQDGDGLTDLMEARLGTNPAMADTDGDGLRDATDANPTAAPRALSEGEEVIRAALEARYRFAEERAPALFYLPKGVRPFEFLGWTGPVVTTTEDEGHWSHPLAKQYEHGVGLISVSERRDASEVPPNAPPTDRYIVWNPDHSEATVTVSTYYGGLNGTGYEVRVRRFGNDWLVVGMSMAWIS